MPTFPPSRSQSWLSGLWPVQASPMANLRAFLEIKSFRTVFYVKATPPPGSVNPPEENCKEFRIEVKAAVPQRLDVLYNISIVILKKDQQKQTYRVQKLGRESAHPPPSLGMPTQGVFGHIFCLLFIFRKVRGMLFCSFLCVPYFQGFVLSPPPSCDAL